jgi:hypothetical protein
MSRSQTAERSYTNTRERAEKASQGYEASYLALPDGVQLYKPKAGVAFIDIMPYEAGPLNPWADEGALHWERTFFVHKRIGITGDTYICPLKSAKQRCPICEYRAKLDRDNPEDEAEHTALKDSQRQIFNIRDGKAPDKGIQIWEYSYHLFGKVLEERIKTADENDGWDLFFTAENGSTLRISFAEENGGGYTWVKAASIDFKPRSPWNLDKVLAKSHNLDDIINSKILEYDELNKIFTAGPKAGAKPAAGKGKPAGKPAAAADDFAEDDAPAPTKPAPRRATVAEQVDDFDAPAEGEEEAPAPPPRAQRPAAPAARPAARRPAAPPPAEDEFEAAPEEGEFEAAPEPPPRRPAGKPAAAPARRAAAPPPAEEDFETPEEEAPRVRTQTQEEADDQPAPPPRRAAAPAKPATKPAARPAARPAAPAAEGEWDDFEAPADEAPTPKPKAKPAPARR